MPDPSTPRVLAILVVHDGARWLTAALEGLGAQDHPGLEVVAVDNGSSDGSREVLLSHLDEQRVLVAERDLGFGQAISMALDAVPAADVDHLLLMHDDCVLEPGAVRALVDALEQDPRLAVVGPKLVDWDDPSRLQSVGWTVDLTGRADSGLEADELDQGQRDQTRRVLYVSTAGMLVRRDVFEALGRFDRRYHLFRDDLDLCWRAWLAGHDVEVVPGALARHVAGATNYARLGQTAFLGPRYFAERNTLATLLKNYGWARLAYVMPLFFAVGIAKVLGFVATRRLSDAWQTVRAWLWNGYYLRRTLRLRRSVQASRLRADSELRALFGRIAPRVRAYAEAIGQWIAGPELGLEERPRRAPAEPRTATRRLLSQARTHPVLATGLVLGVLGLVIALPLLGPGSLRGGDLAPWPASPQAFLSDYVASWHDGGGVGSARPPSPAQAVLGLVQVATLGSAWLASRLVLLGVFPVAWILALRAGLGVSPRRLPRIAAATAYVLSPPALAAARTGDVGALMTFVALPALVAAYRSIMRTDPADPTRAWRATAAGALTGAVMIAFEPATVVALIAWIAIATVAAGLLPVSRRARREVALRVLVSGVGALVLLVPWVVELVRGGIPTLGPAVGVGAATQPFWRWLLLAPDLPGFTGVLGGLGFAAAGALGLVFGLRRRPASVAGLWTAALAGVYTAWALARATAGSPGGPSPAWPGLPLLVTAGAFTGLLAVAFERAGAQLTLHDFGWRQLASLATGVAVAASLVVSVGTMARDPWGAFAVGEPALPAFIPAQATGEEPFRVLMVADRDDTVAWDVTRGEGPTMAAYGAPQEAALRDRVDAAIEAVVEERDPGAAGHLALLNVRYVVVPAGGATEALDDALASQLALEPQPVAAGDLYAVNGWLPRAAFVSGRARDELLDRGELSAGLGVEPLEPHGDGRYTLEVSEPGLVTFSDPVASGWVATLEGRELEPEQVAGVAGFEVDEPGTVVLRHAPAGRRSLAVTAQALLVLLALSLMLRPPRFAREQLRGPGDARHLDPTTDGDPPLDAQPADVGHASSLLTEGSDR